MGRLYHTLKLGARLSDSVWVNTFSAPEWFVLGAIALVGVLSCVRILAAEALKENQVHQLRVTAAWMKIKHLRSTRELQEPTGVDIIDDEELTGVDIVEEGMPVGSVEAGQPVNQSMAAAA